MAFIFSRLEWKTRRWLGRYRSFFHPWPKLSLIISSIPVSSIPSADAAGCGLRPVSAVITSRASREKPGFPRRWRMASTNENQDLGIEPIWTRPPIKRAARSTSSRSGSETGPTRSKTRLFATVESGWHDCSLRKIVHRERLLKITAAADQLGPGVAYVALQCRAAFRARDPARAGRAAPCNSSRMLVPGTPPGPWCGNSGWKTTRRLRLR